MSICVVLILYLCDNNCGAALNKQASVLVGLCHCVQEQSECVKVTVTTSPEVHSSVASQ